MTGKGDRDYFKVGTSNDPKVRLKELKTGLNRYGKPEDTKVPKDIDRKTIKLINSFGCSDNYLADSIEESFHKLLIKYNVIGEWFSGKEIHDWIVDAFNYPNKKKSLAQLDLLNISLEQLVEQMIKMTFVI